MPEMAPIAEPAEAAREARALHQGAASDAPKLPVCQRLGPEGLTPLLDFAGRALPSPWRDRLWRLVRLGAQAALRRIPPFHEAVVLVHSLLVLQALKAKTGSCPRRHALRPVSLSPHPGRELLSGEADASSRLQVGRESGVILERLASRVLPETLRQLLRSCLVRDCYLQLGCGILVVRSSLAQRSCALPFLARVLREDRAVREAQPSECAASERPCACGPCARDA
jgi:hypothetical protein